MPKGRVENKQCREASALREVNEETGLAVEKLTVEGKLVSTWHTTRHNNTKYLKKTHWFLMRYDGDETPYIENKE